MRSLADTKQRRVGYVALSAPDDRAAWSGTNYYIGITLKRHVGPIHWMGPLEERYASYFKAKQLASMLLFGRRRLRDREPLVVKGFARQVEARLRLTDADIVFSSSTLPIAYLNCKQPIFFWTDATFAAMLEAVS